LTFVGSLLQKPPILLLGPLPPWHDLATDAHITPIYSYSTENYASR